MPWRFECESFPPKTVDLNPRSEEKLYWNPAEVTEHTRQLREEAIRKGSPYVHDLLFHRARRFKRLHMLAAKGLGYLPPPAAGDWGWVCRCARHGRRALRRDGYARERVEGLCRWRGAGGKGRERGGVGWVDWSVDLCPGGASKNFHPFIFLTVSPRWADITRLPSRERRKALERAWEAPCVE